MPIEPDALIASRPDGTLAPRDAPLALDEVPIVRVLNAGVALVDQPPRPMPAGFAADALRQAAPIGAELKDLALPKDKSRPHRGQRRVCAARPTQPSGTTPC